ncbi:hypothetical protein CEUSTIGMA_g7778.t1 [Chlamydomonas eustigma]|uniref:Uncharacterized protein n=1 Tax=Chlamydomonas eustigma TaxID=1157962 RepID=A0A250XC51_9CHLO|nr:hypothetical protein CEUSTIGMA_g7778.t1 [Chlamydomonas eustigma]|eukprot:GAX80340.1 hypothetical protein CEUSTIGMA_g7778.t1 [Chlamydomonas eustigma]
MPAPSLLQSSANIWNGLKHLTQIQISRSFGCGAFFVTRGRTEFVTTSQVTYLPWDEGTRVYYSYLYSEMSLLQEIRNMKDLRLGSPVTFVEDIKVDFWASDSSPRTSVPAKFPLLVTSVTADQRRVTEYTSKVPLTRGNMQTQPGFWRENQGRFRASWPGKVFGERFEDDDIRDLCHIFSEDIMCSGLRLMEVVEMPDSQHLKRNVSPIKPISGGGWISEARGYLRCRTSSAKRGAGDDLYEFNDQGIDRDDASARLFCMTPKRSKKAVNPFSCAEDES